MPLSAVPLRAVLIALYPASLTLLWLKPAWLDPVAALLFIAAIWVGLLPSLLHAADPAPPPLPFLPLAGIFYVTFFALPPFLIEPAWWTPAGPDNAYGIVFSTIPPAVAVVVLTGLVCLVAGFLCVRALAAERLPGLRLPREVPDWWVRALAWTGAAAHLAYLYIPAVHALPSVGQALMPLGFFAIGLPFLRLCQGRLTWLEALLLVGAVLPLKIGFHLLDGLMTPLALFLLFLVLLFLRARARLPAIIIVLLGLCLIAYPANKVVQSDGLNSALFGGAVAHRDSPIGMIAGPYLFTGEEAHPKTPAQALADRLADYGRTLIKRFSLIAVLTHVVETTPAEVPYWNGATLVNLVTSIIPRALWPDKPREELGNAFGHRYNILSPDDDRTSWNVPWLVEFYANFGLAGVAAGFLIAGCLLGLLEATLNRPGTTDVEFLAGATLLYPLFYQDSNVSVMAGSLIPLAVLFLGGLALALALGERAAARRPIRAGTMAAT